MAHATFGNRQEAEKILEDLKALRKKRYVPALYPAVIHSALGQKDAAYQWGLKAFDEHTEYLVYLKVEPAFDLLRGDSRVLALIKKMGL